MAVEIGAGALPHEGWAPAAVFHTQEVCVLTIKYLARIYIINIQIAEQKR